MTKPPIVVHRDGAVARVTLNRPEKRNALDLATWRELATTMNALAAEDALRCVVVGGAGGHFAGGADISAFADERDTPEQVRAYGHAEYQAVRSVQLCPHPTVASIAGACVGGGLEIALACDIRIAGASARFGAPINRLGLTMSFDELRLFVDGVGRAVAMELLLEGSIVDAGRAQQMGIVNRVVPDDQLVAHTTQTVERVTGGAPLVNRWHKKFLRRLADPAPLSEEEVAEGYAAFATEDYRVGYRAFLDKRTPEFRGR